MEVTPCTQNSNRKCFCKPGFYCTRENNYVTHCHKPCVPCTKGTFSDTPSLNACKPHKDCAQMIILKEGTAYQDRECVNVTTVMPISSSTSIPGTGDVTTVMPVSNSTSTPGTGHVTTVMPISNSTSIPGTGGTAQHIVTSEESQSHWLLLLILMLMILFMVGFCLLMKDVTKKTFSKCFGFINGGHEDNPDRPFLTNSQFHPSETKEPVCSDGREVKGQTTGLAPQSGAVQQVTMEHNGKGENVSNTVGSIYIYSPGMVILGSNSGDKKEEAGVCEEGVPLISRPQQESNPPSQEVRIRISAQEEAEEELSLSFPVPATGK
ncbi:hypothetical protein Q8A67_021991 [Cirrhinus molitorella]|uniref:Tumor necrosis factor receptor superfamily member 8 n=1 Tax=Cirrhinus molitorella TaxID=172907 RepID=A0AA88P815_9TELE|nr:hypothetical protein Q8A67_021991 [Cirrhinus molitorella]